MICGRKDCRNNAVWNSRCEYHGGKLPSVTSLMKLLGNLTGWGEQSLTVRISMHDYKETREPKTGYSVDTTICGAGPDDRRVSAYGVGLEAALWDLCEKIADWHKQRIDWHEVRRQRAVRTLEEFLKEEFLKSMQLHEQEMIDRVFDEVAGDFSGIIHRVLVARRASDGQFIMLRWACSGEYMSGIVATLLTPGKAITCLTCLGTEEPSNDRP